MKKFYLILFLLITAGPAMAGPEGVGLGVILGDPTGLSFKTWTGRNAAVDAAAAWSLTDNSSFQLHADYLIHPFEVGKPRGVRGPIWFYYGFGGVFEARGGSGSHKNDALFGIRFPLGFSHVLASAPVEFFAELVPILDLVPATEADLNAAIGARFYFR